jgi:hexosaminidase
MNIIPLPEKIECKTGEFCLTQDTAILTDSANLSNANYLRGLLTIPTGFPLEIKTDKPTSEKGIYLHLNPLLKRLDHEGYRLEVNNAIIVIEALHVEGVFYGIQTLRQLLPVEIEERHPVSWVEWQVPCVIIEDKPRFPWRGFMLDESRHFHGKETVKLTLELMAMQKLNVFHWHLTDDQGWRIEIKKFPKLTEVGAHRAGTSKTTLGKRHDGIPHGGFYTRDDIRQIVAFARERSIQVVPEIEMPGHSRAALAAYPELSCSGGPFEVATHFGIFPDIYCAGKENVFSFLQGVIDEILELFPSRYIHIGGDEAPKKRWKECPDCQLRIREEGLEDEHALQIYFTNRIAKYLKSKGRNVIGWNEILKNGLEEGALVQFWARNRKGLVRAIRQEKRKVVMSTYLDAYLDHSYSLMPLSRAYLFDPIPQELDTKDSTSVQGVEFPLWAEWVPNRARLDYQTYPRLTAMAETGWTQKNRKDYNDFRLRLDTFLGRLDRLGVRYAPLGEVEPPKVRQWFGVFTIPRKQTRTAR